MVLVEPDQDLGYELQINKIVNADKKLFFISTPGL